MCQCFVDQATLPLKVGGKIFLCCSWLKYRTRSSASTNDSSIGSCEGIRRQFGREIAHRAGFGFPPDSGPALHAFL